jgi:hypothetical protein
MNPRQRGGLDQIGLLRYGKKIDIKADAFRAI